MSKNDFQKSKTRTEKSLEEKYANFHEILTFRLPHDKNKPQNNSPKNEVLVITKEIMEEEQALPQNNIASPPAKRKSLPVNTTISTQVFNGKTPGKLR